MITAEMGMLAALKSIREIREKLKRKAINDLRESIERIEANELGVGCYLIDRAKEHIIAYRSHDTILDLTNKELSRLEDRND